MKTILTILLTILVLLFGCQSDFNITKKELGCQKLTKNNSMSCCMQLMSSKTGNDSKDAICQPLVTELRESLREARKRVLYEFCELQKSKERCFDKLNSK